MGEYNAICAISDLPITEGDRVKMVFLKEEHGKGDVYWLPSLPSRWVPLALPVSGIYQGHGFIREWQEGHATHCLHEYFSGVGERIYVMHESEEKKFECERDFDKLTDAMVRIGAFPYTRFSFGETKYRYAFCFVLEEVWNWIIEKRENDAQVYDFVLKKVGLPKDASYRQYLEAVYDYSIQSYLCPSEIWGDRRKGDTPQEHFANGGLKFLDYPDSTSASHKYCQARRSRDDGSVRTLLRLFGESSDLLAAGMHVPFIYSYDLRDEPAAQGMVVQEMIDVLLVCEFMQRGFLNKTWQALRTTSYGDDHYSNLHLPWLEFKGKIASEKYQRWRNGFLDE